MHLRIKTALVATCVAVLLAGGNASASSFADVHGFSAKGIAMGNAMTAIVNDWSSVYYNMAGLGKTLNKKGVSGNGEAIDMGLKRKNKNASSDTKSYINEVYLGMMYTVPVLSVDYNKAASNIDILATDDLNYGILNIGLAVDINLLFKMPDFISSARVGVGMGAPADGAVTKVNDISADTHNLLRYGREAQMAKIMVGFGFGFLNDMFGVGLGVNASFSGSGSVIMRDVEISGTPQTPDSESRMDLSLHPSVCVGAYFDFGKVLPVLTGLDVGVSYRQETAMKIDPFDATADVPNTMTMSMALSIFDYYAPHTVTAGVAYTRWGLTFSADVEIAFWKTYVVSSAVQTNYDLPEFRNIIIPKIGIAYELLDWVTLMGGYTYQPSFIPDGEIENTEVDYMDNDKHIVSLGASFKLPWRLGFSGPIEVTFSYQFQYLPSREILKADNDGGWEPDYAYGGTCHAVSLGFMLRL